MTMSNERISNRSFQTRGRAHHRDRGHQELGAIEAVRVAALGKKGRISELMGLLGGSAR